MKNYGLLEEVVLSAKDYRSNGLAAADKVVLRQDGNFTDFLPEKEYQAGVYFDSMACVSFSADNCLETIGNVQGIGFNLSDRWLAKMSGTTKKGNYLREVAECLRKLGGVEEARWPFPRTQRTPVYDWDDFYSEIPEDVKAEGLKFLEGRTIQWEWVDLNDVREYLKFGPIQVTVYAWPKPQANGIYTDGGQTGRNHAVELYNATPDYYEIFDHYDNTRKKLAPNYRFGSALQFYMSKGAATVPTPPVVIPNDYLVQETEKSGAFALHLNGKLWVDDLAKVMATWIMRTGGNTTGKTRTLTKAEWDAFLKVNLKNQPV